MISKIQTTCEVQLPGDNNAQLQNFAGQIIAIKCGGSLLSNSQIIAAIIKQISDLTKVGAHIVLIHGGGKHITAALNNSGIESKKIEGLRVTDKDTLDIVIDVLSQINENLV